MMLQVMLSKEWQQVLLIKRLLPQLINKLWRHILIQDKILESTKELKRTERDAVLETANGLMTLITKAGGRKVSDGVKVNLLMLKEVSSMENGMMMSDMEKVSWLLKRARFFKEPGNLIDLTVWVQSLVLVKIQSKLSLVKISSLKKKLSLVGVTGFILSLVYSWCLLSM